MKARDRGREVLQQIFKRAGAVCCSRKYLPARCCYQATVTTKSRLEPPRSLQGQDSWVSIHLLWFPFFCRCTCQSSLDISCSVCLSGCGTDENWAVCWCGSQDSRKFPVRRNSITGYFLFIHSFFFISDRWHVIGLYVNVYYFSFQVLHHLFQAILHWRVQVRPRLFSFCQVKLCGETCSTTQVFMSLAWITINTAGYELAPLTLGLSVWLQQRRVTIQLLIIVFHPQEHLTLLQCNRFL